MVCGRSYGSAYDEELRAYKVFHTEPEPNKPVTCEDRFFKELLRIYLYLADLENSITISHLIQHFDWLDLVLMKKEMLKWCMERGYLSVDNLLRIEIPTRIVDECTEIFTFVNLTDEEKIARAIAMLKEALDNLIKRGELKPVEPEEIPIKDEEPEPPPSTLFDKIDTSTVELKRDKKGMATAKRTGAHEIDKRVSAGSRTMERRRLEQKE